MTITIHAYAQCGNCHQRVIYATTPTGQWLPPVNWGPDPAGEIAITQSGLGSWHGRFTDHDEAVHFPEQRFRLHECQARTAA